MMTEAPAFTAQLSLPIYPYLEQSVPPPYPLADTPSVTTIEGVVKSVQLVFSEEVSAQLGLTEGDRVEVQVELLRPAASICPSLAWVGRSPPFGAGQDSVTFYCSSATQRRSDPNGH